MTTTVLKCDASASDRHVIGRAVELFQRRGVVIFPTETVYGVGVAADNAAAVARLRQIKHRGEQQPFTVHLPSVDAVGDYIDLDQMADEMGGSPGWFKRWLLKVMPGPITIVVKVEAGVIGRQMKRLGLPIGLAESLYHHGTIGLRCPDHPVAQQILAGVGRPVIASSANRSGQQPPISVDQIDGDFQASVDLVVDGGACERAGASTIVQIDQGQLHVLREGYYSQAMLEKMKQYTILFLCSGNTCRSPMAEKIAQQCVVEKLNLSSGRFDDQDQVAVMSAGTYTMGGSPMAVEAQQVLTELGVPNEGTHVSQPLTESLVRLADVIYCMGSSHYEEAVALAGPMAGKVRLLDPAGQSVADPIGGGQAIYLQCAGQLQHLIGQRMGEWDI